MPQAYKKTMKLIGSFALNIYMQLRKSFLKEGKKYFLKCFSSFDGSYKCIDFLKSAVVDKDVYLWHI